MRGKGHHGEPPRVPSGDFCPDICMRTQERHSTGTPRTYTQIQLPPSLSLVRVPFFLRLIPINLCSVCDAPHYHHVSDKRRQANASAVKLWAMSPTHPIRHHMRGSHDSVSGDGKLRPPTFVAGPRREERESGSVVVVVVRVDASKVDEAAVRMAS